MDDKIKQFLQLSQEYKDDPLGFINALENLLTNSTVPENEWGNTFLNLGIISYNTAQINSALTLWKHALKHYIKNKDHTGEAACYGNSGNAHHLLGEYKTAIEHYKKALEIYETINDPTGKTKCQTNLKNTHQNLNKQNKTNAS